MPSAIPGPLPAWASTLVSLTSATDTSFLHDLLTYFNEVPDPNNLEWRKLEVRALNLASSNRADDAWFSFDIVNITGGSLDPSWTTADYTTCETAFNTFVGTLSQKMSNVWRIDTLKWYRRRFNPYGTDPPFQDSGPPLRVTSTSNTGLGSAYSPPQAAITFTEKTAWPHHWGRFYMPGITSTLVNNTLQLQSADTSFLATAYQTLMTSLVAAEFYLVVPITQVHKNPYRGLLQVTSVQVDSIVDVIRRRRPRAPLVRTVKP